MKTPEAVRDEAAKNWTQIGDCELQDTFVAHEDSFRAGYDYAVKHDPRVLALIEAVTHFLDDTDSYDRYVIVVRALKAWEGEK
jgi:hypothetical protein